MLQVSDVTFPWDSIGNSNTIVDTMLAALVENSDKSVGGAPKSVGASVEDTTAATEDSAAAEFVHHLVKTCGKTANFWTFYKLYGMLLIVCFATQIYPPRDVPHLVSINICNTGTVKSVSQ